MCCLEVRSLNIFGLYALKKGLPALAKKKKLFACGGVIMKIKLMQPEGNKQKNLHSGVIRFSVSS